MPQMSENVKKFTARVYFPQFAAKSITPLQHYRGVMPVMVVTL